MKLFVCALTGLVMLTVTPALAEFAKVDSADVFKNIVDGKTLTRPLVKLRVGTGGSISGTGAAWAVTGNWTWEGGYFCRSLEWGGDDLGYNCQEVQAHGDKIRFTSDQGSGDSLEFKLR